MMGLADRADRITVHWPSGVLQEFTEEILAGHSYRLVEGTVLETIARPSLARR